MILSKEVEIILNPRYIRYWEDKGYLIPKYFDKNHGWKVSRNAKIKVKVEDLSKNSHVKVLCKCDKCGQERLVGFYQYRDICDDCKNRIRKGENHPFFGTKLSEEILNKQRKIKEDKGLWTNINNLSEWLKYRRIVKNETNKWKRNLFENWDGTDFYTGEKLVTNEEYKNMNPKKPLNQNLLQPTVDHKLSLIFGFNHNIDPIEIGRFENLCVCGKQNNSKKNYLIEKDFISKMNR